MNKHSYIFWVLAIANLATLNGMIDKDFPHLENPFNQIENNSNDFCGDNWDIGNFAAFTPDTLFLFSRFHTKKITKFCIASGTPECIINDFCDEQSAQKTISAIEITKNVTLVSGFGITKNKENISSYSVSLQPCVKYVRSLAVANKEIFAAGMTDGSIIGYQEYFDTLWQESKYKKIFELCGHQSTVSALAFLPQKPILISGSGAADLMIWDTKTETCIQHIVGVHQSIISSIVCNNSGSIVASTSLDGMVVIWNTTDWTVLKTFKNDFAVGSMTFSPDDKRLFVGTWNGPIFMWDIESGKKIHTFQGHAGWVSCVVCHKIKNKNILFSCARDGSLMVWDVASEKIINGFQKAPQDTFFNQLIFTMAIHPDGWLVCYCNNEEIYFLDLDSLLNPQKALSLWKKSLKAISKKKRS